MIELITGTPGSGKTMYAVRLLAESVERGRVVITNLPLEDDWAEKLARGLFRSADKEKQLAHKYRTLVFRSDDLDEILRVRVRGKKEERADLILDECHRWMNSRQWDQAPGQTKDEAVRTRLKMVGYFSGHRHYGIKVYLITQDERNIDNQIRWLYEFVVRIKNLRNIRVFGFSLFPINLFVAVRFWNDKARSRSGVQTFLLSRRYAGLYRTHALAEQDMPDDAIWMPRRAPQPPTQPPQLRLLPDAEAAGGASGPA